MYLTVVIDEKSGYPFSSCVSKNRDRNIALRTLTLAMSRTQTQPALLKIDGLKSFRKAAEAILPPEKILSVNKNEDYGFNNAIERWFSHISPYFNKHECRFRRPYTLERAVEVRRYYRSFLEPYQESGKTPAELLGMKLPIQIKDNISFIPLLEFANCIINYVEGEAARLRRIKSS
jgi:transposase-like protein